MTRRKDTLKKEFLANREALSKVDSKTDKEGKKWLYKKGVTVDADVKYGLNQDGKLTGVIAATKSRTKALENGEAYGGYHYASRGLRGDGIADIVNSIEGDDKSHEDKLAQLHEDIKANEGKPVTKRVAFETTTFRDKKGNATISLKDSDITPATVDFKEEDKLATIAKEVQASEAEAKKSAESKTPAVEAEDEEIELS